MTKDDLSGKKLDSVSLSGDDMSESNLSHASLRYSQLKNTRLHNADLSDSDLHGANLRHADVSGANLTNADLSEADVHGVDLGSAASLHGANLEGAQGVTGDFDLSAPDVQVTQSAEDTARPEGEDVSHLIAAVAVLNGQIATMVGALDIHLRSRDDAIDDVGVANMALIRTIHRLRQRRDALETDMINALAVETDAF